MNAKRRKRIAAAVTVLDTAYGEEEAYFANMPENLQEGDPGEEARLAIDALETAIDALEELV